MVKYILIQTWSMVAYRLARLEDCTVCVTTADGAVFDESLLVLAATAVVGSREEDCTALTGGCCVC